MAVSLAQGHGCMAPDLQDGERSFIKGFAPLEALAKIAELSNIELLVVHQLHEVVAGSVMPLVGLQCPVSRETKSEIRQTGSKRWSGDKVGSCGSGCSEDRLFQGGCGKCATSGFEHFQQGVAGRS